MFGPDESKVSLEESFMISMILDKPEDKTLVRNVAQRVQEFYFGTGPITYAPDSGVVDVSAGVTVH
jgi:hypothetical protein